jgi:hypothetical protein
MRSLNTIPIDELTALAKRYGPANMTNALSWQMAVGCDAAFGEKESLGMLAGNAADPVVPVPWVIGSFQTSAISADGVSRLIRHSMGMGC